MREERLGGHHLIASSPQCQEGQAGHQFSEETQLNSMNTRPLDRKESFLTVRAASLLHQAGVCVICFHVSCFQTSWTWHRLCCKLRSTHLVAITVKEVCAVTWRKDTLLTVILTLALSRWKASCCFHKVKKVAFHLILGQLFVWLSLFYGSQKRAFLFPSFFHWCQELVNLFARQSMIFPRLWSKKRTSPDLREKEDWWPSWQGQDGRSRNGALLSGRQLVVLMLWMVLEFRFTWNVLYLGFSLPAKNTKHFQSNQKIWIN